MEIITKITTN